ncbi:YegP family protein [Trabulsiella odontotermitis]|uniref:YegP family protein n=1 Tax=Trabulsiella odontotermitis TaxID=379893 RepID=UPI0024B6547D|nr:YegP family protein [Trabulsiella odontotermitis]WHP29558.1 YegP family protein [Trabulsiella odontotermitis]
MGYYVIKKSEKNIPQPYYFQLKADNHETIAVSEMYSSKDAAKKGIASVQKNGPTTTIKDETV